jgi:hypothetical protein
VINDQPTTDDSSSYITGLLLMAIACKEFVFWIVERDREGRKKENKKLLYEDFTIE